MNFKPEQKMNSEPQPNTSTSAPLMPNPMLSEGLSYRQSFGLENPPPGTKVRINFLEGCNYSIIWDDCPDGENVIEGWFKKKQQAIDYVTKNGWLCK